jgi:hypothetical protein
MCNHFSGNTSGMGNHANGRDWPARRFHRFGPDLRHLEKFYVYRKAGCVKSAHLNGQETSAFEPAIIYFHKIFFRVSSGGQTQRTGPVRQTAHGSGRPVRTDHGSTANTPAPDASREDRVPSADRSRSHGDKAVKSSDRRSRPK